MYVHTPTNECMNEMYLWMSETEI